MRPFPVQLNSVADKRITIFSKLCMPSARPADLPVHLLLHGATHDHTYWDFGTVNGERYSYMRSVSAEGFATVAIDMIGTGGSAYYPSPDLSFADAADVTHQVVQALRNGSLADIRFNKVITVGSSLGSLIALQEAISYRDIDGVITTGIVHHVSDRAAYNVSNYFYAANQDPAFSSSGLDDGYWTTKPNSRRLVFYNASGIDTDPDVIARDESTKSAFPSPLLSGIALLTSIASREVDVPVLMIIGTDDVLCDETYDCSSAFAVKSQESSYYDARANLEVCVVPDGGHALVLQRHGKRVVERSAVAWSNKIVFRSSSVMPSSST